MLLKFTDEQNGFILNERRNFNASQEALAQRLPQAGLLIGNASPLPREVWGRWDQEAVQLNRSRLAVFNEFVDLSEPVPIGVLVSHFAQVGDSGAVSVTMDGREDGKTDAPEINYIGTPVPIIKSPFSFGWRQIEAMRRSGSNTLESAASANAQRKVAEKMEDLMLNGDSKVVVAGARIYGLRNLPQRNTGTHALDLNGATGANWLAAVTAAMQKLIGDSFFDPVTIFLNYADWFFASTNEFAAGYPKTILQRLMEIPGIAKIVPASSVPANEVIGVVKRRDVVKLLNGMPMVTRPKTRLDPEDDYKFDVLAAVAPQLQHDASGNCGIVQLTKA
ncbi:major capsid protein [Malikia spinosa]|uniref:major capsid protein n=1 Tax=Malikia spinosa TaxID=86180 RepID=UPI002FDB2C41